MTSLCSPFASQRKAATFPTLHCLLMTGLYHVSLGLLPTGKTEKKNPHGYPDTSESSITPQNAAFHCFFGKKHKIFRCEHEVMKGLRFLRFVIDPALILCFSLHVYKILDLNSRSTVLKKKFGGLDLAIKETMHIKYQAANTRNFFAWLLRLPWYQTTSSTLVSSSVRSTLSCLFSPENIVSLHNIHGTFNRFRLWDSFKPQKPKKVWAMKEIWLYWDGAENQIGMGPDSKSVNQHSSCSWNQFWIMLGALFWSEWFPGFSRTRHMFGSEFLLVIIAE